MDISSVTICGVLVIGMAPMGNYNLKSLWLDFYIGPFQVSNLYKAVWEVICGVSVYEIHYSKWIYISCKLCFYYGVSRNDIGTFHSDSHLKFCSAIFYNEPMYSGQNTHKRDILGYLLNRTMIEFKLYDILHKEDLEKWERGFVFIVFSGRSCDIGYPRKCI